MLGLMPFAVRSIQVKLLRGNWCNGISPLPVFRGHVSQEVVRCPLNLWKKCELPEDARPDVVEIFPRLEKPDDSPVARRFSQVLELPVVPVNHQ